MPSRTDFLAFGIANLQAGFGHSLSKAMDPTGSSLQSSLQHLSSFPPGCPWGFSFCLQGFRLGDRKAWDVCGRVSYIYLTIFSCWIGNSTWLTAITVPAWCSLVSTHGQNLCPSLGRDFSVRLLQVWSPETAVVTAWHPPAGIFSCPGAAEWLPSTSEGTTEGWGCFSTWRRSWIFKI